MPKNPDIFLSYSHRNSHYADEIDNHFLRLGIRFLRDIRNVNYKSSIKSFMARIRDMDFVVMLISDNFLKSFNCMYEVLEVMKECDHADKILQILLPDSKVFNSLYRTSIIKYWQNEKEVLVNESKGIAPENAVEINKSIRHYAFISQSIGEFLEFLADSNSISYVDLKNQKFRPVLDYMKLSHNNLDLLSQIIRIGEIEDKIDEAIALEEFTLKYPGFAPGFFSRALHQESLKAQIYYYDKAVGLDPMFAIAYLNRGLSKRRLEDFQGAIADYTSAIKIDPSYSDAYNNRGNTLLSLKQHKEAIVDLDKAIELNPQLEKAYTNRGDCKSQMNDYLGAIEDYDFAIEINSQNPRAYLNRGTAKVLLGLAHEGVKDYDTSIILNPTSGSFYIRGLIKLELGQMDGANRDFDEAIALDPDYRDEVAKAIQDHKTKHNKR